MHGSFARPRRPSCAYAGKKSRGSILAETMAVPLQVLKRFGDAGEGGWVNKLAFGDNLQVLKTLLEMKERGELRNADGTDGVRLCYIDPPFATKREFRTTKGQVAYRDKVEGAEFIEFLRRRVVFIHELLAEDGTLYLHLDTNKVHYLKAVLDEIFGSRNLLAEIVWKRTSGHGDAVRWSPVHETILAYTKSATTYVWNVPREPLTEEYTGSKYVHDDGDGRGRYRLDNLTSPNPRPNMTYTWRGFAPPAKGWRYSRATMDELDADGRIYKPKDRSKRPQLKRYLEENEGRAVDDLWADIPPVNSQAAERLGYPTQKPLALLDRIINASSNPGDIVLDCFAGSGTTPVAAEQLERRWIAVDCGKLAVYVTQRRLLGLTAESGLKQNPIQPLELCSAALYDNKLLEDLAPGKYETFCLELFGCRPSEHKVGGLRMAGTRKGAPVHFFPFHETDLLMGRAYIESLHDRIRSKVSGPIYVIAPESSCDPGLFENLVFLDENSYFVLRVPYSVIEVLHGRRFELLSQPSSLSEINDALDSFGFDFSQVPEVDAKIESKGALLRVEIHSFMRGGLDPDDFEELEDSGRRDLAMVLVDTASDGDVFNLTEYRFGDELAKARWKFEIDLRQATNRVWLSFMDVQGNELRQVIEVSSRTAKARKPAGRAARMAKARTKA